MIACSMVAIRIAVVLKVCWEKYGIMRNPRPIRILDASQTFISDAGKRLHYLLASPAIFQVSTQVVRKEAPSRSPALVVIP